MRTAFTLLTCIALSVIIITAHADDRAEALIKRAQELAASPKTLDADLSIFARSEAANQGVTTDSASGHVYVEKPNKGRLKLFASSGQVSRFLISDGTTLFNIIEARKAYVRQPSSPDGIDFLNAAGFPLGLFFSPLLPFEKPEARRYIGKETVSSRTYEVVEITSSNPYSRKRKLYFGPNGLLEGEENQWETNGKPALWKAWLKNVRLDAPMSGGEVALTPPPGYAPWDPTTFGKGLRAVGTIAPDFRLPSLGGGQWSLAEARKSQKAVLINFWFYECAPCRAEFPKFQKLYNELKTKGLEIVTINSVDSEERIRRYIAKTGFTFKVLLGKGGMQFPLNVTYGVDACPTSYLVDGTGAILWRTIGYDEAGLLKALKQVGLK